MAPNPRTLPFADCIDRLTGAIGRAAAWLALAIVLLQFALVVGRYALGLGSIWLTETVIYANAALFLKHSTSGPGCVWSWDGTIRTDAAVLKVVLPHLGQT